MADDSVGRAHTSNEPVNASGSGVAAAASTPARPFTVVVVGAGLGGLCFANGLVNGVLESPLVGYKLLLNDSVDQNSGETAEAGASTEGKDASQATAGDDTPPSAAAGTATDGVEPASKAATAVPQDDRAQPPGQSSDGGTAEAHGSGAASPASRGVGDAADAGGANGAGTEPEVDAAFCPGIKEAGGNMRLVVLERDETPDFRSQGYYIGIQQHGLDAMKAVGLLDAVVHQPRTRKAHGREAFEFVTQKGKALMSLVASQDPKNKFAAFSMHRQRLRDALLEPVREYVQFGATVKRVVPDDDVAKVLLDNGDVIEADVVVGADGVNSKVRNALMLPDTRRDAGIRSLGGALVDKGQLEGFTTDAASFMVVERGPSMFVGRYTADSRDNVAGEKSGDVVINWGVGIPTPEVPVAKWALPWLKEEADPEELRDKTVKELTARGWHPSLLKLIQETPADRLRTRDLFDREPLAETSVGRLPKLSRAWPDGRVTLVGDAAHPMTPYQGAGGNTSLMDGAWLAAALLRRVRDSGHSAVPGQATLAPVSAALREYEKEMFIRSAFYVKNSYRACSWMHANGRVKAGVRNMMMRGMGWLMKRAAKRGRG